MTTLNPTPTQIRDALRANGCRVDLVDGWSTRGREWAGPDGSRGLLGVVVHHTSTASATGSTGAPSLEWAITGASRGVCNALVGRDGTVHLIAAGSAFHSGNGGPWPAIGVPDAGNRGHYRLFGIEIDDPGVADTITAAQKEAVGRICGALKALCGWGDDRIITHADWTDSGPVLGVKAYGPYRGRKNDPLRRYYPTSLWRELTRRYAPRAPVVPATGVRRIKVTGSGRLTASDIAKTLGIGVRHIVARNLWLLARRARRGDMVRVPAWAPIRPLDSTGKG